MNTRYVIDPDVRAVTSSDGAILLHLQRGTYSALNPVAMKIWQEIERGLSVGEILIQLQTSFPSVGTERLACDLSEFLAQLARKGLARVS